MSCIICECKPVKDRVFCVNGGAFGASHIWFRDHVKTEVNVKFMINSKAGILPSAHFQMYTLSHDDIWFMSILIYTLNLFTSLPRRLSTPSLFITGLVTQQQNG